MAAVTCRVIAMVTATVLLGVSAAQSQGASYSLRWWSIDGGGSAGSSNSDHLVRGTIGQPDAGAATSADFMATSGFWSAAHRNQLLPGDGVETLALTAIPLQFHRRAAQLVEDVRSTSMAPGWDRAYLADRVRPLYRPDVQGIAYYEFSVITGIDRQPAGFIVLSSGEHDFPIAHWNFIGRSPCNLMELQAAQVRARADRCFKLDVLSYVAESADGEDVAHIGNRPVRVRGFDLHWLDEQVPSISHSVARPATVISDDRQAATITHTFQVTSTGRITPTLTYDAWQSWSHLKSEYASTYALLIESLRRDAAQDWQMENAILEAGEGLSPGSQYGLAVLHSGVQYSISGSGRDLVDLALLDRQSLPPLLEIRVRPKSRVLAEIYLPSMDSGASLSDSNMLGLSAAEEEGSPTFDVSLAYQNGIRETIRFMIAPVDAPAASQSSGLASMAPQSTHGDEWSPWVSYWAGSTSPHAEQPLYDQFLISTCLSGCGATAWAMLFGWGDYQAGIGNPVWIKRWGLYREDGSRGGPDAVAPRNMESGVENITREIKDYVDSFCWLGSKESETATAPWTMGGAYRYLDGRSGASISTAFSIFGIPWDGLRDEAMHAIRVENTPAIIGTGWLDHYPLAYGLAGRWRFRSVWLEVDRWFYINKGWGNTNENGWIPARTWFVGRLYP